MKSLIFLPFVLLIACSTQPVEKEIISTADAPKAIGPYSQAVQVGNTIYLSGQIAIDPVAGKMVEDEIKTQTTQVMKNIDAVLTSAGFSLKDVVQSQVFLADLNDYAAMNEVYSTFFTERFPARAAVQVARLPLDARVEIMVTAVKIN